MSRDPALKRCRIADKAGGFTLVEVLVGLVLLATLGGALSALQVGTLRANRNAQVRLQAAALLADELALQRVFGTAEGGAVGGDTPDGAAVCALPHLPDEWLCTVERRCLPLPGLAPCAARLFAVELRPPSGEPLKGYGASLGASGESP